MTDSANTVSIRGYHGDFFVTITMAIESPADIPAIMESITQAGVQASREGLEADENTMTITKVAQRKWRGKDQKDKHAIDMYTDFLQWRAFTIYIDSEEDAQAFENASGLKLDKMPSIQGAGAVDKQDDRLASTAFDVVYKIAYNKEGKRSDEFVRYANQASTDSTPAPASNGNGASSDNGSKPANTKQVTLQAALYVMHVNGVRTYVVKDIDGNKYTTTRGSLIEFASEHPGKLEPDTAHKILGLGGAIATVNADTQEVTAIEAEATADAAVDF